MDTQQITPVQGSIPIPPLIAEEEMEPRMARTVLQAWAARRCPGEPLRFLPGRELGADIGGRRYRFQCQKYTGGQNTYGFRAESLAEVDWVLLFREAPEGEGRYQVYCCPPEDILGGKTSGRRVISPDFSGADTVQLPWSGGKHDGF